MSASQVQIYLSPHCSLRACVRACEIKTIRPLIWTSPGRNIKSFLTRSWHCMLKAYRNQSTIKTGEFVTHLLTKDERLQSRFLLEPFKSNTVHHVRICDVHMAVLIWCYTPSWCQRKQMATSHVEIPNQMSHMVRSAELGISASSTLFEKFPVRLWKSFTRDRYCTLRWAR
jgi:hypothetical protein